MHSLTTATERIRRRAFEPVDNASLIFLRITFGFLMLLEAGGPLVAGYIGHHLIEPAFMFKFYGFGWVHPWPGDGMVWHMIALCVLGVFVCIGLFFRVSCLLFLIGTSYVFLLDQTHYLNHIYLIIIVGFLLMLTPAHRSFSIDVMRKPSIRSHTTPRWTLWVIMLQFEIVLLYAGIVKINPDWLQLEPLRMWLYKRSDYPIIGELFLHDWAIAVGAYGTILLHLVGAPLLLWRTTRIYVFIGYFCFHTLNHFIFNIGVFPWITLAGTLMFFDPGWPRHVRAKLRGRKDASVPYTPRTPNLIQPPPWRQTLLFGGLGIWFAVQIFFPLRHLLYPGDVAWTEEGHRFSWRMKLRDKQGDGTFYVKDPDTDRSWRANPEDHLTPRQAWRMTCRPDMVLQYAHHVGKVYAREHNIEKPQVYAWIRCSLNGREYTRMFDPHRDLMTVERSWHHDDWILPLDIPLDERNRDYQRTLKERAERAKK